MYDSILNYLLNHYCSLDQLVESSPCNAEEIDAWINAGCLPDHSYCIDTTGAIHSFFGAFSAPDIAISAVAPECRYFNPSHVEKLQALCTATKDLEQLSGLLMQTFFDNYTDTLSKLKAGQFGMHDYIDAQGRTQPAITELLNSEWQYYLQGVYGLCTRTTSTPEIAIKEASIRKINFLTNDLNKTILDSIDKQELRSAVADLDRVSAAFAPHEYPRSSRYKYIDQVRELYSL